MNEFTGYPLYIIENLAFVLLFNDSNSIEVFCKHFNFQQGTLTYKSHNYVQRALELSIACAGMNNQKLESCLKKNVLM